MHIFVDVPSYACSCMEVRGRLENLSVLVSVLSFEAGSLTEHGGHQLALLAGQKTTRVFLPLSPQVLRLESYTSVFGLL